MEKNKYQKAKDKAALLLKFFTAKQNFESVKIKDSELSVEYAELVVGADVSISSSTGSEVNLSEDVKSKEDEDDEKEKVATELEADTVKVLEDKIAKMEEMIVAIMAVIELQPSKVEVEDFKKKVEALAKLPTQFSADNREEVKESQLEKFAKLAEKYTKK